MEPNDLSSFIVINLADPVVVDMESCISELSYRKILFACVLQNSLFFFQKVSQNPQEIYVMEIFKCKFTDCGAASLPEKDLLRQVEFWVIFSSLRYDAKRSLRKKTLWTYGSIMSKKIIFVS